MTKPNKAKANSNQLKAEAVDWFGWEIKDFQYQVELFRKCGKTSENCPPTVQTEVPREPSELKK